jgi:hypothetical protein
MGRLSITALSGHSGFISPSAGNSMLLQIFSFILGFRSFHNMFTGEPMSYDATAGIIARGLNRGA